jgi:hypothetical protein
MMMMMMMMITSDSTHQDYLRTTSDEGNSDFEHTRLQGPCRRQCRRCRCRTRGTQSLRSMSTTATAMR